MKYNFCTLFDKNYLPHVLSLYDSLKKFVPDFTLYCLCMDDRSYRYLQSIENDSISPVSSLQLEDHYPELLTAKKHRSKVEYYFTCSSSVCSYVFDCYPGIEMITYLDADLYFFSSPVPIFRELENASVGIIEHGFSFFGKRYIKYGRFNVGWVSFRNDPSGRKCLEDWRQNCLEWCYDRLENGKFADQKYLDYWSGNYSGVHSIQHIGANLGPWNVGRFRLTIDPATRLVKVNDQSLIFYHFASFKQVDSNNYITQVSKYFVSLSGVLRYNIYMPYLESIKRYNDILGIEFNVRDRKDRTDSGMQEKLKRLSRNFRRFVCRDNIEI